MKSRIVSFLLACAFAFATLGMLEGCTSTPATSADPRQQAVDATYKAAVALDASITATRGAVLAGALKGNDAVNAMKAFDATYASLRAAQAALQAAPPSPPASGASK